MMVQLVYISMARSHNDWSGRKGLELGPEPLDPLLLPLHAPANQAHLLLHVHRPVTNLLPIPPSFLPPSLGQPPGVGRLEPEKGLGPAQKGLLELGAGQVGVGTPARLHQPILRQKNETKANRTWLDWALSHRVSAA